MRQSAFYLLLGLSLLAGCGERPLQAGAAAAASAPLVAWLPPVAALPLAAEQRIAALEQAVTQLQAEAAASRGAQAAAPGRAQVSTVAPVPEAARVPPSLAAQAQEDAAQAVMLQAAFRNERADPAWARSAELTVRQAVQAALPPDVAVAVECRSRSCRVALSLPASAGADWMTDLAFALTPVFGSVTRVAGDGPGSVTLYVQA